jgi:hypothetical protein
MARETQRGDDIAAFDHVTHFHAYAAGPQMFAYRKSAVA